MSIRDARSERERPTAREAAERREAFADIERRMQDDEGIDLASSLERLRQADAQLARRRQAGSGLGETDLAALRLVLERRDAGEIVTPTDLAEHLQLTSSAVTTVVDRLVAADLVSTQPHPSDRRRKVIAPVDGADEGVDRLDERIRDLASELSPRARLLVAGFLDRVTRAVQEECR
jgi:DNA-binding MarR family transcriptional regulator